MNELTMRLRVSICNVDWTLSPVIINVSLKTLISYHQIFHLSQSNHMLSEDS